MPHDSPPEFSGKSMLSDRSEKEGGESPEKSESLSAKLQAMMCTIAQRKHTILVVELLWGTNKVDIMTPFCAPTHFVPASP